MDRTVAKALATKALEPSRSYRLAKAVLETQLAKTDSRNTDILQSQLKLQCH